MSTTQFKEKFQSALRHPQVWGFFISVAVMAVVSLAFFAPNNFNGDTLSQYDMQQGAANGEEGRAFEEATGEKALWTNALFSGMPTFQISPEYPSNALFSWLNDVYGLWLPSPSNLLFMMMLGMLICCYCLRLRWWWALIAALAWGLSSYFVIIIGAGHIWKFMALTYMPPTIGAVIMAYRGRWLAGSALLALFAMLEINANHPQITYYSAFILGTLAVAFLVSAIRKHAIRGWLVASVACLVAGGLAVGANAPSLYNTYEYSKETKRAASELTPLGGQAQAASAERPTGGLPKEEIGGWSNLPGESFTLLVPNLKGGATVRPLKGSYDYLTLDREVQGDYATQSADQFGLLSQFTQYFGGKGMTNGPFYLGAVVIALFLLGCFIVRGPVKWAFLVVTLFSILLAMGNHFETLTDFMIYNVPLYNKFRAAETALVIAAFCVPVLAAMGLQKLFSSPTPFKSHRMAFIFAFGIPAFLALLAWLTPSIYGEPFTADEMAWFDNARAQITAQQPENLVAFNENVDLIGSVRLDMVAADGMRSFFFILFAASVLFCASKLHGKGRTVLAAGGIGVLVLIDLYSVDKRYISSESFVDAAFAETGDPLAPDAIDQQILQDKGYYRVADLQDFGQARRSYYHHMVGGYHAAKLNRYNDLIERRLNYVQGYGYMPEIADSAMRAQYPAEYQPIFEALLADYNVLNMLNAKYIINKADPQARIPSQLVENPGALGAAWLVDEIEYVDNADAEMAALGVIDPAHKAVADRRFADVLGAQAPSLVPGDSIWLEKYTPNTITYGVDTRNGGLAVFSEVWFPWGWTATVDGKEVPLGRVNYVLRAMNLPAGKHTVVMTFDPQSLHVSGTVAYASVTIIYLQVLLALFMAYVRPAKPTKE